jgi:hypothetical protein
MKWLLIFNPFACLKLLLLAICVSTLGYSYGNGHNNKHRNNRWRGAMKRALNEERAYKPSERGPVSDLPDDQNAPYRIAPAVFCHCGFTLTQLKRAANVAIYKQTKGKQSPAFEVRRNSLRSKSIRHLAYC